MEQVDFNLLKNLAENAVKAGDIQTMDKVASYIYGLQDMDSSHMDILDMVDNARINFAKPAPKAGGLLSFVKPAVSQ